MSTKLWVLPLAPHKPGIWHRGVLRRWRNEDQVILGLHSKFKASLGYKTVSKGNPIHRDRPIAGGRFMSLLLGQVPNTTI